MPKRHEVDSTTQASMLPPTPEQMAVSAVVELEGGYYAAPAMTAEAQPAAVPSIEAMSPEDQRVIRLQAEDTALAFLDRAARTERNLSNMKRGRFGLEMSGVKQAEQARLSGSIESSEANGLRFRRIAHHQFARSIGIETKETTTMKFIEAKGIEKEVIEVIAKDSQNQAELAVRYRPFLAKYKEDAKLRQARRAEIAQQIGAA